jgi:hypothetical protein
LGKDRVLAGRASDKNGVHFIGLVNVVNLKAAASFGKEQLAWLEKASAPQAARPSSSLRIPLWSKIRNGLGYR